MAVNIVCCLYFGEVFYFLAQNLFGNVFLVVLVGVGVNVEGHQDEVGNGSQGLVVLRDVSGIL